MTPPVLTLSRLIARAVLLTMACCGVVALVLLYTPVPDYLSEPLLVPADRSRSDAIVLMAAWASPDGVLNDAGLRRTLEASRLYKAQVARTIVVVGRNRSENSGPTSRVMADLLAELGVPPHSIAIEDIATNTHEAAVNIRPIAQARGWSRLTLVSDGRDMRRALAAFRRQGLNVAAGADPRWDARTTAGPYRLQQFQGTLHEWLGLGYYWWKGWI